MLVNMIQMLANAEQGGYAVGAFNIVNQLTASAIIAEADALRSPVILQTSMKTVQQIGAKQIAAFVRSLAEDVDIPVALHLDHCTDIEMAKQCIDCGYTSVMLDMSQKPLDENIRACRQIVEYAHSSNVSVEGEIGTIVGVEEQICVMESKGALTDVSSAREFVGATGIDCLAPAIGTAHGLYKGEPKIAFDLFKALRQNIDVPMVIHGGTGLSDDVFRKLIQLGAAKINISTALKLSYCWAIAHYLSATAKKDPLALDMAAYKAVREMANSHIKLFGSTERACV